MLSGGKPSPEAVVTMASPPQSTNRCPSHGQSVENNNTYIEERWALQNTHARKQASDASGIA